MAKKFWYKNARPTKEEKPLIEEVTAILNNAESSENKKDIYFAVDDAGKVRDANGLRALLEKLKSIKSSPTVEVKPQEKIVEPVAQKEPVTETKNTTMEESKVNPNEIQDEAVQFEEVIDIQKESQFATPVIEREDLSQQYTNPNGGGDGGNNTPPEVNDGDGYEQPRDDGGNNDGGDKEEKEDGNLGDLPSGTKRKAINKTADIASMMYAGMVPLLPKWIAKVPTAKIQKMYWAGEIDINMELDAGDGTSMTVGEYYDKHNANVDASFVVTEEMQKEFREALKDVLEEKQVAATPIQRLTGVVVMHLATMLGSAIAGSMTVKRQTTDFKTYHEEAKQHRTPKANANPIQNPVAEKIKEEPVKTPPPPDNSDDDDDQDETGEISINPDDVKG